MPRVATIRYLGAADPRARGSEGSEPATLFVQHEVLVNISITAESTMSLHSAQETIQERRHRLSARGVKYAKSRNQLQTDRIAHLEGLVDSLEKRFREVESRLAALQSPELSSGVQSVSNENIISADPGRVEGCQAFEGDTSFASQSLHASNSAHITALSASTGNNIPDIEHSIDHIQKSLYHSQELSRKGFYLSKSSQHAIQVEPLPATLVTSLLRRMRDLRESSPSSYLSVFLRQRFDLTTHLDHCEKVFAATLETYDVLAVPSFENILALTMGMVKAQGEAKPALYWTLVSAASMHCQSLGYHRETTYRNILSGKADNIRRLFWDNIRLR
ncbi:fungal specific transcription factor domain-containing protein [Aspergillus neoniger CBS 115656]|uniref:Transcription factor domain-containing protein n=1 Tax=Aspergillus neoniger (strain CBS 115656) TaxID=1448310 RepID=A0A318ZCN8_ASPNB|nr:hypothetical protein BO87DRAFT_386975 [Aspergillus neoniger CBS 115656]PYH34002.1 hypothetical protein BO87DRAFT_386975 [Aspergillus neoniger CBS 115656]